jgi:PKD repeat protein
MAGRKLTVTQKGDAAGTVTSNPAGINCGADCIAGFTQGSSVTLSAVPDTNRMVFSGWSGACTGMGTCIMTINADTSVSAEFNHLPSADFTPSATSGNIPSFQINFTNNSSHYTSLLWNFGDGSTSTEVNPAHTFMTVGIYTVSLTASNPYGGDTKTATITVLPCPDSPVRINRGDGSTLLPYSSLQSAYDNAINQDIIEALDMNFIEDLNLNQSINVGIKGGFACGYNRQIGNSSIEGQVRVSDGIVRAGNLRIVKSTPGNAYAIASHATPGGGISPAGTVLAGQGRDITFSITPEPNYSVQDVVVDGESIGAVYTYTMMNVTTNHRIEAIFTSP